MDREKMQPLARLRDVAAVAHPMIAIEGLSHTYQTRAGRSLALSGIDLSVAAGRFTVIVGPSGCGKSSLLMMMAGLRRQSEGQILCDGRPIETPDPDRVGVVFQEANLFPWLTAADNVAFPLALRRVPKAERLARAAAMLRLVGLAEAGGRYPHELSGGMKQRVSIARGLVQDPPVLLLDEPFAALDEQTRMSMGEELLRIWSATRKTVVFVTHSLTEAVYLADEVLVMSAHPGRIIDRIDVGLPRPRTYEMMAGTKFAALRDRIWQQIRIPSA
jgi:NitT/TauT family transport system ATP-binding protein